MQNKKTEANSQSINQSIHALLAMQPRLGLIAIRPATAPEELKATRTQHVHTPPVPLHPNVAPWALLGVYGEKIWIINVVDVVGGWGDSVEL